MMARWMRAVGVVVACAVMLAACSSPEEKKARFYEKGMAFLEQGDLVKARLELKNAIQIDPKYAEAYYGLGQVELEDKDPKKAFGLFSKAVELDEGLLDAQVALGNLYLMARQVENARARSTYVLEKQPDHRKGRLLEAGILISEKRAGAAGERLDRLLSEGFKDPQLYMMLASIRFQKNDSAGGRQMLRDGIAANPGSIRLRSILVAFLVKDKAYDEAIALVKEAIEIEPENKAHKVKLATLYWDADQQEQVEGLFDRMIAEDEAPMEVRILAAEFYARKNDAERAVEVINDGIKQEPGSIKLRLALATLQKAMRRHDQALVTLEEASGLTKDDSDPDLLKVKNHLARLHLGKGDLERAKKYADEVISASGGNVEAQYTAGQIYLRKKDGINAVSAFRKVVSEKPDFIDGHLHLAQAHLINKEKELAVDVLNNGLAENPEAGKLRKALARIYAADKDFDRAEKELRSVVEQNPKDLRASGDLADFLFMRGKADDAMSIYDRMVMEQPRVPAGYLKLAAMQRARKNNEAALEVMERGYAAIPQSPQVLTGLVKSYIVAGKQEKAVELIKDRLKSNDQDLLAHNLLGEIYVNRKQYDDAAREFEKAIAIRPEWQTPHNNLARVLLSQGKTDEAILNLNAALEKNPKNAAAYMTLANLYSKDGQQEKVFVTYEKALEALPNLWPAANNLAYMLSLGNGTPADLERAHDLALKAVALQPERPSVLDTLGWVHLQRGEADLAITELEKAVEKDPDASIIQYHLGLALMKVNRLDEARQMLEKALMDEAFPEREAVRKALEELSAG